MSTDDKDRILNLLADRATRGLSQEELMELNELLKKNPQRDNPYFDLTAAVVSFSDIEIDELPPDTLRQKIMANAFQYVDSEQSTTERRAGGQQGTARLPFGSTSTLAGFQRKAASWQMLGWYLAAACFILAISGWWPRLMQRSEPSTLSEMREKLLAESTDLIKTDWKPASYQGTERLSGDVVWSNARQQGFIRFTGMPVIDPQVGAYQLWIFDANQDEKFPVDGGVFAVDQKTGEVIVRINAKLKISQPRLFAITVEKPGGVVVSKRNSLVAVAKID
jgi:hypothetical protein